MGVRFEGKSDDYLRKLTNAIGDDGGGLDAASRRLSAFMSNSMPDAPIPTGKGGWTQQSKFHSQPGQPPFAQTGGLRRSIGNGRTGTLRWAAGTLRVPDARTESGLNKGMLMEFGTATIAPRPWARPALRNNKDAISRAFSAAVERKMGGGA